MTIIIVVGCLLGAAALAGGITYIVRTTAKGELEHEMIKLVYQYTELGEHLNRILRNESKHREFVVRQLRAERDFLVAMQARSSRTEMEAIAFRHAMLGHLIDICQVTIALDLNEADRQIANLEQAIQKVETMKHLTVDFADVLSMTRQELIAIKAKLKIIDSSLRPNRTEVLAQADQHLLDSYSLEEGCTPSTQWRRAETDKLRARKDELFKALQDKTAMRIIKAMTRGQSPKKTFKDENPDI